MDDAENKVAQDVGAAWLSDSLLLMVGAPDVQPGDTRATLVAGGDSFEVAVRCMSLGANGAGERKVLTAALDDDSRAARSAGELSLGGELRLSELVRLLNDRLAGLDDGAAKQVAEFIAAAPAAHGMNDVRDLALSNRLHTLRNVMRPRLPAVVIEGDQPLSGNIDLLVPIDETSFYVKGWMRDAEAPIMRLTAVTAEGERVQLHEWVRRLPLQEFEVFAEGPYREPVDAARFVAHFHTTRPSRLRKPWVFELQNETGRAVEMYALPDPPDVAATRMKLLRSIPESWLPDERLMADHVFPAVDRLQQLARESITVAGVADYGQQQPESPDVSIVVPLYGRIDFVEHQLLQFDSDPELRAAELIYVLDSPELEAELGDQARQLARLYGVPFRVATMSANAGFGGAINAGAKLARGRLLLLLNSDVIPAAPGWLGTMQAFYDATPDIGALGAKLLYEDDSLQHAGLFFDEVQEGPTAGAWANMHYYKGLHKDLPAANVARPIPAVTAACLMIDRELFYEAGGMPDVYVQGDYEDSELCLRLLAAGRANWYLPGADLYHLEGSSYTASERGITGSYNRWLQTARMGDAIAEVMTRFPRV